MNPRNSWWLPAVLVVIGLLVSGAAQAGPVYTVEVEPNGTSGAATPLASGAAARGTVYPNADIDFWSFSATAGDRVYAAVITNLSAGSTDSVLDLVASNGTTVIESDDNDGTLGTNASSIAGATIPTSGTYFLRVKSFSATGQLRPYRLFLQTRSGAPTAETEPNDDPAQALPGSGWLSGMIEAADTDRFSVALQAGDTVFLSLDLDPERDATDFAGVLGLGFFSGAFLTVDDLGTGTPDSEALAISVKSAGTYEILVEPTGTDTGTYQLSVSILPAAAEGGSCTTYAATDVPQSIPTGPGQVSSTITIPGHPRIADLDVAIDLTHARMDDLDVHLVSPEGNDNGLWTDIGAASFPAMDLTFDDEAAIPINSFPVVAGMVVAPELNYRLSWYDGEDAGGDWTLTLRDDLANNGGTLNNWSIRICEPASPPVCPPGTTPLIVYETDFETGDGGFTHSGTADEWELGLPSFAPITTCASGTNCWKTDLNASYNASSNQDLFSPTIALTGGLLQGPVVVSWFQRYSMEGASFDQYFVDLQLVGGASPTRLFEWLDGDMTDSVGNPSTAIKASAGWGVVSSILPSAYLGQNVELRYNLKSDSTTNFAGVAVDDVSVTACQGTPDPTIFVDDFETGDVCLWSSAVGAPPCP